MTATRKPKIAATPPPHDPNERDKAAIAHATARVLDRRKRASVRLQGEAQAMAVASPHSDAVGHHMQLLDTFGTPSEAFLNATLSQLLNAINDRGKAAPSEFEVNAALAIVGGLEPTNEVEALLASQMAATHGLAMVILGRARRDEFLKPIEAHGNLAVKLLRTFALQAETLAKLRRGGGQTVRVEHVHVHAGGQAIVGNVTPGGGAPIENEDQPHAKPSLPHADAPFDPLRRAQPERPRVPIASHA